MAVQELLKAGRFRGFRGGGIALSEEKPYNSASHDGNEAFFSG
jgi:hypothetical protein